MLQQNHVYAAVNQSTTPCGERQPAFRIQRNSLAYDVVVVDGGVHLTVAEGSCGSEELSALVLRSEQLTGQTHLRIRRPKNPTAVLVDYYTTCGWTIVLL